MVGTVSTILNSPTSYKGGRNIRTHSVTPKRPQAPVTLATYLSTYEVILTTSRNVAPPSACALSTFTSTHLTHKQSPSPGLTPSTSTRQSQLNRLIEPYLPSSRATVASLFSSTRSLSRLLIGTFPTLRQHQQRQPPLLKNSTRTLTTTTSMAWRSSGTSNSELVANLCRNGMIKDDRVKEAFLKVGPRTFITCHHPTSRPQPLAPLSLLMSHLSLMLTIPQVDRAHYAPSSPYNDSPQSIGHGATISAPHMHATAAEHLLSSLQPPADSSSSSGPNRPRRVLDIGSGSGYLTHVLAELLPPPSETPEGGNGPAAVVGLEHIPALKEMGERNMSRSEEGRALLASGRVRFRVGDGRKGWVEPGEEEAGWDAIHVGASAVEVHDELIQQLRSPGRMFIPVDDEDGGGGQHIWAVDKDAQGVVTRKRLFGVRYVPLTDAPK